MPTSELKERKSLVTDMTKNKQTEDKNRIIFLQNRERDRQIVCWRGILVWALSTAFFFMLLLLILFLYLISRTPLTEDDLQQCRKNEFQPNSDVVQFTQLNYFNLTSQKDSSWLVELYSPLCSHCKKMRNAWEETATVAKEQGNFFQVGKVDCKCEVPICRPFALRNYPGIYLIENGEIIQYDSKTRTKDSFLSWARQVSYRYQKLGFEM